MTGWREGGGQGPRGNRSLPSRGQVSRSQQGLQNDLRLALGFLGQRFLLKAPSGPAIPTSPFLPGRVQREQLAAIFRLMKEKSDTFGEMSEGDMKEQLRLYDI